MLSRRLPLQTIVDHNAKRPLLPRLAQFITTHRSDIACRHRAAVLSSGYRGCKKRRRVSYEKPNAAGESDACTCSQPSARCNHGYSALRGDMHCVSKDLSSLRFCMSLKWATTDMIKGHVSGSISVNYANCWIGMHAVQSILGCGWPEKYKKPMGRTLPKLNAERERKT